MALLGNLTGSSQFFNPNRFYNDIATQSLRFDDGSSAYLTRTPSSTGNRRTFTISCWVKRSDLNVTPYIFKANTGTGDALHFRNHSTGTSPYALAFFFADTGQGTLYTSQKFRDTSAWYHIVASIDTTQGTASNRVKLYVNGTQITAFDTANYPSQNYDCTINTQVAHLIGAYASGNSHYDGYMSEFNFVDGTQLTPTSFGETKNGVWIAKKYTGSYGTNGFRLKFDQVGVGTASTSTIGADTSGNTHHFTSSGIVASDCNMPDSPENNFATWNSLRKSESASTFSEGNLKAVIPVSSANSICATMGVSSGKYYWEVQRVAERPTLGVGDSTDVASVSGFPTDGNEFGYFADGGNKYPGNSSYGASYANGDIIGFALDMDAGTVVAYKNNSSQGTLATGLTDTIFPFVYNGTASLTVIGNFGQDSSFAGTKTAQGNTDGNGKGDFYYAPPSGFLALCTSNLPEPTISPNAGDGEQADDYFNTVLYTGTGSSQVVTGVGFQPDWVWLKNRGQASSHNLFDSNRGEANRLAIGTSAEDQPNQMSNFASDGFTVPTGNNNGIPYVAWNWKANGGTTSSNTDGSITSTVQANTDAGFSIVTYTGTGSAITVGHGLGNKPEMIIAKRRDSTSGFPIYHQDLTSASYYVQLNSTSAQGTGNNVWNQTDPTSTVFTVGTDMSVSSGTYVAYVFSEIESYSRFGSYTGNGNADGTFVYTGFRPQWLMMKQTNASGNWYIWDNTRELVNPVGIYLLANGSNADGSSEASSYFDFLSNGFKLRANNSDFGEGNTSGNSYIYMAFAEAPFKYANGV